MSIRNDGEYQCDYIRKYLKTYFVYVDSNEFGTHVSMNKPYGKYLIKGRNEYIKSFELSAKITNDPDNLCSIAELPQIVSMLCVDVDCKAPGTKPNELWDSDDILKTVEVYQEVLKKFVKNVTKRDLQCVVLTKDPYMKSPNVISHGYHLQFPYLFLYKDHQRIITNEVKKLLPEVDIDDIAGKPWLMYRHSKSKKSGSYEVNVVVDADGEIIEPDNFITTYELYDIHERPYKATPDDWTRVLSINLFGRPYYFEEINFIEKPEKVIKKAKIYPTLGDEEELKSCKKIMEFIKDEYAESYDSWMAIGMALYTCLNGSLEGLELWKEFSQRCDEKYDENKCVSVWACMKEGAYNKGTLIHYLKKSVPNMKFK